LRGEVGTFERGSELAAEPIDKLPPPRASLLLRRDLGARAFLEAAILWVDRTDRLSSRDRADHQRIPPGGTPGYVLLDFRGACKLWRGARLGLGLENLLDAEFRVHGSGQNGPGRNLTATLELRF
jgi:hemoglobin/transferrin/lactoferrin receptor protein